MTQRCTFTEHARGLSFLAGKIHQYVCMPTSNPFWFMTSARLAMKSRLTNSELEGTRDSIDIGNILVTSLGMLRSEMYDELWMRQSGEWKSKNPLMNHRTEGTLSLESMEHHWWKPRWTGKRGIKGSVGNYDGSQILEMECELPCAITLGWKMTPNSYQSALSREIPSPHTYVEMKCVGTAEHKSWDAHYVVWSGSQEQWRSSGKADGLN